MDALPYIYILTDIYWFFLKRLDIIYLLWRYSFNTRCSGSGFRWADDLQIQRAEILDSNHVMIGHFSKWAEATVVQSPQKMSVTK